MLTDLVLPDDLRAHWGRTAARAQAGLEPYAGDSNDEFSPERWKALAALGFQGLPVDPAYGGQGADARTIAATAEAIGYVCTDNGMLFSVGAHVWSCVVPLNRFGSPEQKDRYLPGLCDGSLIGVQAMTEPGSGSDAFSMHTTARVDGDEVVLNGSKLFITNAPVADVFVVFASSDRTKGWGGLSAFVVDRGTRGLTVSKQIHKLGIDSSPFGELHFDECRIPASNTLNKIGAGMIIFTHSMDWERTFILVPALGTMRRQLERVLGLAARASGAPARLLHHKAGGMAVRLYATRLLYYRNAERRLGGRTRLPEAAMMKLALSEAWVRSCEDQLEAFGIAGQGADPSLQAELHDALGSRIYSGTSQIQRDLVAQQLKL